VARKTTVPQAHAVSDGRAKTIVEEYATGASSYQLAKKHGLRRNTIRDVLRRNGIELREGNARRLDEQQKQEIRARRAGGEKLAALASDFGVSVTTIKRTLTTPSN
jgi:lambda repressor-like predicted transcriptional regulator